MKFNLDKLNSFLEGDYPKDIKDFVIDLFKLIFKDRDFTVEDDQLKVLFFDLGFYELENTDKIDITNEDEYKIINFNIFKNISKSFRKMIFKNIKRAIKNDDSFSTSESFFESFLKNDVNVIQSYNEWLLSNRKYKLEKLNEK
jgi:hypothetical protein